MGGNVTIEPLARATAVQSPEIQEVRSLKSGQVFDAKRFIQSIRYDRMVQVRGQIKEAMKTDSPRIACAICGVPVYIAASCDKAFFFRHRVEDGSCPARTSDGLSEADIRAMKYRGAQESEAHRRLKTLIERSLRADTRFDNVLVEETWRGFRDPSALRRPDVQAMFEGLRLAFEAQLSTTFLDVVLGRKSFYKKERALLIWILPYFDPMYRRLTIDDILFNNNSNVLVVDCETTEASERTGGLTFRCEYRRTVSGAVGLESIWESRLFVWDHLTRDLDGQRIFAFDTEGNERTLLAERQSAERAEADDRLRDAVLLVLSQPAYEIDRKSWAELQTQLARRGLDADSSYGPEQQLRNVICGVMSAKAGRPIGYRFEKLIQVAHHLAERFPSALIPFGHALRRSGHDTLRKTQDRNGSWERRAPLLREAIRAGDPSYRLSAGIQAFVAFLFPEIATSLQGPHIVGKTSTLGDNHRGAG